MTAPPVENSFACCGVRVDAIPLDAAVDQICCPPSAGSRAVHLCNAYTLALASTDQDYAAVLNRGDLNLADGMPLVWIARALGFSQLTRRVYGPDLMNATFARGRTRKLRHFLLGGTTGVLRQLRTGMEARWPGVTIVGSHSPPFRELHARDEAAMLDAIRHAAPDVVWVALGTPKQDFFIDQYRDVIPATLVAVGAAFDFLSGNKRQAPRWARETGLEWAFRLASEPRRLWRRYLFGNARFLAASLSRRGRPRLVDATTES